VLRWRLVAANPPASFDGRRAAHALKVMHARYRVWFAYDPRNNHETPYYVLRVCPKAEHQRFDWHVGAEGRDPVKVILNVAGVLGVDC
jgi:hypothetical protein